MEVFVEGFAFGEHRIHDGREFLRYEGSRDRLAFAPLPPLELDFDFGEVLHRTNRRVMKR